MCLMKLLKLCEQVNMKLWSLLSEIQVVHHFTEVVVVVVCFKFPSELTNVKVSVLFNQIILLYMNINNNN